MPKYYNYKVAGYYLYFTSKCIIECMHVHASDRKLTQAGSAKFFVKENGDSVVQNRGQLNEREIKSIQAFIKDNYKEMYMLWQQYSKEGYYGSENDETAISKRIGSCKGNFSTTGDFNADDSGIEDDLSGGSL